ARPTKAFVASPYAWTDVLPSVGMSRVAESRPTYEERQRRSFPSLSHEPCTCRRTRREQPHRDRGSDIAALRVPQTGSVALTGRQHARVIHAIPRLRDGQLLAVARTKRDRKSRLQDRFATLRRIPFESRRHERSSVREVSR